MPVLRSELMTCLEAAIVALGWVLAPAGEDLASSIPSEQPIAVAWRWFAIGSDPDKQASSGTPGRRVITYTLEYKAQVLGATTDKSFQYIAADLPDVLAEALLDRYGMLWSLVRERSGIGRGSLYDVGLGRDATTPPTPTNALGQVYGQITINLAVEIETRTSRERRRQEEGA
jgi:hypothetical protein